MIPYSLFPQRTFLNYVQKYTLQYNQVSFVKTIFGYIKNYTLGYFVYAHQKN
jgi:hypothetical protein